MATINDFINKLTQTKKPNLGTGFLGTSKPATNNFGGLVTPKPASPVVNQSMSPNGATSPKPTVIAPPNTPSITSNPKETFINNLTNTGAPKIDTPATPITPQAPVSNPQNDYLEYLRKQFNPEKGATLSTAKESALTRVKEIQARNRKAELDAIAEQEKTRVAPGGLKSGTDQAIGEIGRKANLEGAYGALEESAAVASANLAQQTYSDYINAGKSVYEAEQAAQKVKAEQNKPFELSEGQARYEFDSATGQYKKVASVGKTYAPSTKIGGVDAQGNVVLTSPQKTKVNAVDAVLTSLDAYKTLYDSLANEQGGNIFGKDAGTLSGAYNALIFQIAQAAGTGALQAADREIVERMIPNPTSLSGAWGGLVKGGKAGGKNSIDQAAQVLNNTKATIIKAPQDPYGFNKQSMILISPDGQEFDASGLTPQELQEAIADGYTSQ